MPKKNERETFKTKEKSSENHELKVDDDDMSTKIYVLYYIIIYVFAGPLK